MLPPKQHDTLIAKAQKVLEAAITLSKLGTDVNFIVCFHIQQYVEKMIKARLIELDIPYDQRHDLFYLLSLLPDKSICRKYEMEAHILTSYAVATRYDCSEPSIEDVKDSFSMAELIVSSL